MFFSFAYPQAEGTAGDSKEDTLLYSHDKVSRMRTSLDAFAALPVTSLPATEVVDKVRAIVV